MDMGTNLIYRTGIHPLNAETPAHILMDRDITPNKFFYARCHGDLPNLSWDEHTLLLSVEGNDKFISLSMDQMKNTFEPIILPVTVVCDGNRRKELNLAKIGEGGASRHTNGFDWGCCALSTAVFKGVLLRNVILTYFQEHIATGNYHHVRFESVDILTKGVYGTSLPLNDVLKDDSDFMIAYGMNGERLPKEHGFPVRTILPGYVGGRTVKWLKRIILSTSESDNFYHLHDNSVFPPEITSTALMSKYINDTNKAYTSGTSPVRQPSVLYELNLNSAILFPTHGERINITDHPSQFWSIRGYAYDGGGRRITRVQLTLDDGISWIEAQHEYPSDYIPPHGTKYYVLCKWKIDVPLWKLTSCRKISVRAWNQSFNTQPKDYTWNLLGMMNNAWYTIQISRLDQHVIEFIHPVSTSPSERKGYLETTVVPRYQEQKVPPVAYTRDEVSHHASRSDCWVIIDEKIYDLTDFASMHPGGIASILAHAGEDVTTLFYDIHSEDTHVLKSAYVIGYVADGDDASMGDKPNVQKGGRHAFLSHKHPRKTPDGHEIELSSFRWMPVHLKKKIVVNHDTRRFTFALSSPDKRMWLPWGKHVNLGVELSDRMVVRPYTPVKPVKNEEDNGTFELVIKIYFPTDERPGGEMTQILDKLNLGDTVLVKGPEGASVLYNKMMTVPSSM